MCVIMGGRRAEMVDLHEYKVVVRACRVVACCNSQRCTCSAIASDLELALETVYSLKFGVPSPVSSDVSCAVARFSA